MSPGFATTILPTSWKPRAERGQADKHQARLHQERSAGKVIMIIFWDKGGVLLNE